MHILGLSTMTESAAVLLRDGVVVAAAEEERFTREKHAGGFPYGAIEYCLAAGSIGVQDLDHVAVYWNPYKVLHRSRVVLGSLLRRPSELGGMLGRTREVMGGRDEPDSGWLTLFRTRKKLEERFGGPVPRTEFFDHHECHMASCFYGSGQEESAVLVLDGAGEAACTTRAVAHGTQIDVIDRHVLPHSLGHFYAAVTGYLGFKMLDGEYKVMGLSPYGDPAEARWIREHFLRTVGPGRYVLEPGVLDYVPALRGEYDGTFAERFGPPRSRDDAAAVTDRDRDVAASAQRAFDEVVLDLARDLRRRTGVSSLTIAGGCGMNSVANGRILREGVFDDVYVPPVPCDAGGALGAAMLMHVRATGSRPAPVASAQLGPSFSGDEIATAIKARDDVRAEILDEDELCARTARTLAHGGVVAWMQGPMEYGPRALGSRSFLADPRSEENREILNAKIKKREPFRPFAPSVKAERADEFFELGQPSPFMAIVVPVRPEQRGVIPAVTHVDGTARPQTVDADVLPRYWKLLDAFERETGVPVVLNTSFNIGEPIVCTPEEALATFARSGADALAAGDHWVTRETPAD